MPGMPGMPGKPFPGIPGNSPEKSGMPGTRKDPEVPGNATPVLPGNSPETPDGILRLQFLPGCFRGKLPEGSEKPVKFRAVSWDS